MAKRRKKVATGKAKASKRSPARGAGGRFISKADKAFQEKELEQRAKDTAFDWESFNPIRERLARTKTKQGGSGRVHSRKAYANKKRVESKEKVGKYVKQTLRVRGKPETVRRKLEEFLKANAKRNSATWVNLGTKDQNGFWYGSKAGRLVDSISYLKTDGIQYGRRIGITEKDQIIGEAVIVTQSR